MSIKSNDPLLKNLQANIVKGHGRDIAFHLFFQFKQGNEIAIRNWISNFAKTELTTAAEQIADTEVFKEANEENDKPVADALRKKPVFTLSLSAHGYKTLGLSTQMPDSTVFKAGMRGNAQKLGDKERDIEECFTHQIDMMILVAVDAPDIAEGKADDIIKQLNGIAIIVKKQRGNVLKMLGTNVGIEHFGYADGVSQPLYLEDDILDQPPISQWDDEEATDILLVEDFFDNSTDAKCYGSYLVFRKLEQDVSEFKAREEKIPPVKRSLGQSDDELAGAMIVGRFEDGSPVTDFDKAVHFVTNDFDYSTDMAGSKCPYHSHIRLVNPRNGLTPGSDFRKHRITRRGMPFDNNTAGNKRIEDQSITCITEKLLEKTQFTKGVGLLFMCYQSDIATQFEVLQDFVNTGVINGTSMNGQDSIIGQGTNPLKTLPDTWSKLPQSTNFLFNGFVKMKGGEYFFTPSVCFLKSITGQPPIVSR